MAGDVFAFDPGITGHRERPETDGIRAVLLDADGLRVHLEITDRETEAARPLVRRERRRADSQGVGTVHQLDRGDFAADDEGFSIGVRGQPDVRIALVALILVLFLLIWAELAVGIFGTPLAGS